MRNFKRNVYSQFGEDGIIEEIFRRLNITNGKACEFGAADGYWLSNTRKLIDEGWTSVQLEANRGQFVTEYNVNELVPQELDFLSIDIDGNDYACWKAYIGKCKVVCIEINSSKDPDIDSFTPEDGSNYSIMLKLAKQKGYELLVHTGNMIFIERKYKKLFLDADLTFDTSWR